MPVRRARRLTRPRAVLVAMTDRAGQAVLLRAPRDVHRVRATVVELQRRVACGMTVATARRLQHAIQRVEARLRRIGLGRERDGTDEREHEHVLHNSASIGSRRMRLPVTAKIAFASAGATGGKPGSPMPLGSSVDGTMCVSITGHSNMRSALYV